MANTECRWQPDKDCEQAGVVKRGHLRQLKIEQKQRA